MDTQLIKQQLHSIASELLGDADVSGRILVLGCSSSEVVGEPIGKATSLQVGEVIVSEVRSYIEARGGFLAVQCCEHLNRALVVEKDLAVRDGLTVVSAVPVCGAGGAAAAAAFKMYRQSVLVEYIVADFGIDIGDTEVGMHVRHVQVPFRTSVKSVGKAHTTCLRTRAKLIGGARAVYG